MLRLLILGIIFGAGAPTLWSSPLPELVPGGEVQIQLEHYPESAVVFVPDDFQPKAAAGITWPVLFYYPGTGGHPDVKFLRHLVEDKGWLLVGLPHQDPGRFAVSETSMDLERSALRSALHFLRKVFPINPAKVIVGGFSKGGWLSGLLVDSMPELTGALILGAGFYQNQEARSLRSDMHAASIFIGVGVTDGNFAMSHGAAKKLERRGAAVTLEVWPGIGHQLPTEGEAEGLRQWLKLRAPDSGSLAMRSEALDWLDSEAVRIRQLSDPVEQWASLDRLGSLPFLTLADPEFLQEARDLRQKIFQWPGIREEEAATGEFKAIVAREGNDRLVETLQSCHQAYLSLAKNRAGTMASKLAATQAKRTEAMLRAAGH